MADYDESAEFAQQLMDGVLEGAALLADEYDLSDEDAYQLFEIAAGSIDVEGLSQVEALTELSDRAVFLAESYNDPEVTDTELEARAESLYDLADIEPEVEAAETEPAKPRHRANASSFDDATDSLAAEVNLDAASRALEESDNEYLVEIGEADEPPRNLREATDDLAEMMAEARRARAQS